MSKEPASSSEAEPPAAMPAGLPSGLDALIAQAGQAAPARPVERWDPADCGDIDMRIRADGVWLYQGSPIGREALVRLFASILRREPDGRHVLVTPVEKVGITVDDAPFLAVEMDRLAGGDGPRLTFRTNVGDIVTADALHPMRFEIEPATGGLKPYVSVRGGLEALLTRPLLHQLAEWAEETPEGFGIRSGDSFFAMPAA